MQGLDGLIQTGMGLISDCDDYGLTVRASANLCKQMSVREYAQSAGKGKYFGNWRLAGIHLWCQLY